MDPESTSIYVHIPWCLSRCPYCDFNTYAAKQWPERAYTDALASELAWFSRQAPFTELPVGTIFFGGGTPSLFAPATIGQLLDAIGEHFAIAADLEVTLEANPGTVDRERFAALRQCGINRLSLGIQSFQPRLLEALGRRHGVDESRRALEEVRRAGFENFSLDLIYAIPTQTLAELEDDLNEAIGFGPQHISAYGLTYEPGTPLTRDLQAGRVQRTPEEVEAAMFERVRGTLGSAGYTAYEISNHAKSGYEARHNQAYWRGTPYLGLGAGAHSFSPGRAAMAEAAEFGVRWQNLRDPARYQRAVEERNHAVEDHEIRTRAQAIGEYCWLGLRQSRGIADHEFTELFGVSLGQAFAHVDDLVREGLLEKRADRLVLSPRGVLVADTIFATFF